LDDHFPLVVWQTGSGTQSNMNVNEVIAYVGTEWLKEQGSDVTLHPNDDVNKSQSSNDPSPTAMHIAFVSTVKDYVLPAVKELKSTRNQWIRAFKQIDRTGNDHLQRGPCLRQGK